MVAYLTTDNVWKKLRCIYLKVLGTVHATYPMLPVLLEAHKFLTLGWKLVTSYGDASFLYGCNNKMIYDVCQRKAF